MAPVDEKTVRKITSEPPESALEVSQSEFGTRENLLYSIARKPSLLMQTFLELFHKQ